MPELIRTGALGVAFALIGMAVALANARKVRNLFDAIETRDVIGQAKGILMERHKLTGDEAFALLARASKQTQHETPRPREQLVHSHDLRSVDRS